MLGWVKGPGAKIREHYEYQGVDLFSRCSERARAAHTSIRSLPWQKRENYSLVEMFLHKKQLVRIFCLLHVSNSLLLWLRCAYICSLFFFSCPLDVSGDDATHVFVIFGEVKYGIPCSWLLFADLLLVWIWMGGRMTGTYIPADGVCMSEYTSC